MNSRYLAAMVLCLGSLGLMAPPAAQADDVALEVRLTREALDLWDWDAVALEEAAEQLKIALAKNAEDPDALYELARLDIMRNGGGSQIALQLIDRILAIDPTYSEAYVLKGHVLTNYGRSAEALVALQQAGNMGSTSPWLQINLATLSLMEDDAKTAERYCSKVLLRNDLNRKARISAYDCRTHLLERERNWAQLEQDFQARIALTPPHATSLSEYARFLCMKQGNSEEGIRHAEKAIALHDTVYGHWVLAACLHHAWGQVAEQQGVTSAAAEALFAKAQAQLRVRGVDSAMAQFGGMADNKALVNALLAKGANVNALHTRGTALHVAARMGHVYAVKLLLGHGADPNLFNGDWSPLMSSASAGYLDVVQTLLDAGADHRSFPALASRQAMLHRYPEVTAELDKRFPGAAGAR